MKLLIARVSLILSLLLPVYFVVAALGTVWMATDRTAGIALAVSGFALVGLGVSASGTSLLVMLAKRVPDARRGGAAPAGLALVDTIAPPKPSQSWRTSGCVVTRMATRSCWPLIHVGTASVNGTSQVVARCCSLICHDCCIWAICTSLKPCKNGSTCSRLAAIKITPFSIGRFFKLKICSKACWL